MIPDCRREADLIDAIASRRWPHRVDGELRAHVAGCAVCADLAAVAAPLAREHDAAWDEAGHLPPAQVVFWRAQVRARAEASRQAAMPIGLVHALSAAVFAGVSATAAGSLLWWLPSTSWPALAGWALALPQPALPSLDPTSAVFRAALFGLGICLFLVPLTIYLLTVEERSASK